MSSAMEKMIANMLGFTPEQMHETLSGLQGLASGLGDTLKRIEEKQDAIAAQNVAILERLENVGRIDNTPSRSAGGGHRGKRIAAAGNSGDASGGD